MRCRTLLCAGAMTLALVLPDAAASDFTIPSGFNLESVGAAGPLAGVLEDGRVLLSTGFFGADELSVAGPGGPTLFATGFGSIAGVAQSPVTGDIVVGDSFGAIPLWRLRDLNGDGDALDAGETEPHPVPLPTLSNGGALLPFDVKFRPGTDEFYVSGSTDFAAPPVVGAVVRVADGVASVYHDGFVFASGMTFVDDALYVADLGLDFAGRIVALRDDTDDGDAADAGEAVEFATGLSGASDVVRAKDGALYVSGLSDPSDFSGSVGRLAPDDDGDGVSDEIVEVYFDGFPFAGALTLLEGPAGFVPGAAGDGALYVGDFTLSGNRVIRSAPAAALTVDGVIGNNQQFDIVIEAAPGAATLFVLALDTSTNVLNGIGDICFGFDEPYQVFVAGLVDGSGQTVSPIVFHEVGGAVGLELSVQAFAMEDGRFGVSNGLRTSILP